MATGHCYSLTCDLAAPGQCTGSNQLHLGSLLCSSGQRCLLLLDDSQAAGASCEVHAEEVTAHLTTVQIELRAAEPPNAGTSRKQLFPSQLVILRPTVDGTWVEAYKTEVHADGKWPAFKTTMEQLCGGNTEMQLRLQAWAVGLQRGRPREDVLLGEAHVSVHTLQDACKSGDIKLAPKNDGLDRSHLRIKVRKFQQSMLLQWRFLAEIIKCVI